MAYVEAAARRAGRPVRGEHRAPLSRRTGAVRSALLVMLIGLTIGTAAAQLRGRQAIQQSARGPLLAEIDRRTADSDRLGQEAARLRPQVVAARDVALGADRAAVRAGDQLAGLELVAGTVAVAGPGMTVRLDDAPPADRSADGATADTSPQGRISDRDLQELTNAIWMAGAEAITINDLRLTAQTAIRSAGEAVVVDFRPLGPPYLIAAIGDPGQLEAAFVDGPTGRRFSTYRSLYGLVFDVRRADRLTMGAAGSPQLPSVAFPGPAFPGPDRAAAGSTPADPTAAPS